MAITERSTELNTFLKFVLEHCFLKFPRVSEIISVVWGLSRWMHSPEEGIGGCRVSLALEAIILSKYGVKMLADFLKLSFV